MSAQDKLADLGDGISGGLSVTIVILVLVVLCASVARFGTWTRPRPFGPPSPRLDQQVGATLHAFRAAGNDSPADLRALALRHWEARARALGG